MVGSYSDRCCSFHAVTKTKGNDHFPKFEWIFAEGTFCSCLGDIFKSDSGFGSIVRKDCKSSSKRFIITFFLFRCEIKIFLFCCVFSWAVNFGLVLSFEEFLDMSWPMILDISFLSVKVWLPSFRCLLWNHSSSWGPMFVGKRIFVGSWGAFYAMYPGKITVSSSIYNPRKE